MRFLNFVFFVFLLIVSTSCGLLKRNNSNVNFNKIEGVGGLISKDFDVDMFRYLEIDVNADVELIQNDSLIVHIESQENVLNLLEVYVSNSHLFVKFKKSNIQYSPLKIVIYTPNIQRITVNGSGNFSMNSWRKEDKLHFINNGSTIFHVSNLSQIKNIHILINGSGSFLTIQDSQLIPHIECELSGVGDINLEKMPLDHANVVINGSGNVEFGEVEQIQAKLIGSGNITYKGNPKITQDIIGSGTIIQK